jgi:hypothetical protein
METHEPITPEAEPAPSYVLPQFEVARTRRRRALDGRVRSIRRTLIAGGLIGTVAFTALAGYESRAASGATTSAATTQTTQTQSDGTSIFTGQANAGLGTSSASSSTTSHARTQSS